ncbi:isoprenylcysteine carboxyl methyltransferase [Candidatus Vecturithrix granuli]|uniref:Isoprenylcysteine carboxyl methyltransferase n=1 Tax=Vecturithrix granuli TaxID=1499967 RepID=A0A081C3Y8_VECG1|nr:isoprenylcysteine carboxyl methyltransferase [Candidatus Vecturithrix granuli]
MNTNTPTKEESKQVSWGRLLIAAISILVLPAVVLFGSSGRLDWDMAWVYIGLMAAFGLGSKIIMLWKTPDLIAERGQALDKEDTKPWDKTLMPLVAIVCPTVMLVVAGLDERFGWSPEFPQALQVTALFITSLGYFLGVWSTVVNKYFSAVVRIQRERGQTVVTSGPYQYVRHPGYAGGIVANFAVPLLLGSLWALAPAVLVNCLIVVRTALEDNTLQDELDGYRDYAERVRYRLLPGVW